MSVVRWSYIDEGKVRSNRTGQEIVATIGITTDNVDDSLFVLKRDLPEFQRWQAHPSETGFFVDEFTADQIRHTKRWTATVRYVDTVVRNPLDEPAELVGIRTETLPGATIKDRHGKLILNTAADVVQPIDKPERIKVFIFEKNLPGLAEWLFDLEDVVNSGEINIDGKPRPARSLLLRKVEVGRRQEVEDISYYPSTIEVAYRKSLWIHRFPSVGFNELYETKSFEPGENFGKLFKQRRKILLKGQEPHEPQILDADGKWVQQPAPEDIVILSAELYEEADLKAVPHLRS